MARYAGDQIANNPEVVANYLRTEPTTRLSTRQLQFFEVSLDTSGLNNTQNLPNSIFSKAVRGIQAQAEVVAIGSPNSNRFMIVVSADTANDGNESDPNGYFVNNLARTLQQSVSASTNLDCNVTYKVLYGGGFDTGKAINYTNPQTITIDGTNTVGGHESSYENETFNDD